MDEAANGADDVEVVTEGWDVGESSEGKSEAWHIRLMKLAILNDDVPQDEEWIPAELRKKHMKNLKRQRGELNHCVK